MKPYITIGGIGSRMKSLSPVDKHLLFYQNQRIIDWIQQIIPNTTVIGHNKTTSRKDTLRLIKHRQNVLIIDCDIIPFNFNNYTICLEKDCCFTFYSNKQKYGSVIVDSNGLVCSSSEKDNISNIKCSGVYYIKDLNKLLDTMDDNSIVSAMNGALSIREDTFKRFGDVEDYMESILS